MLVFVFSLIHGNKRLHLLKWLSHSDLHSYLLGDHEEDENQQNNHPGRVNNNRIPGLGEGLHAAHQAILQQGGPVGFQPYHRPINFPLKVCAHRRSPVTFEASAHIEC